MLAGSKETISLQHVLVLCPNPSVDTRIWFDQFSFQESNRATKEQFFPGGKAMHVAWALKELGSEVKLQAFWAGATGAWLKKQCLKKNITCCGPEVEGWNRFCYTFQGNSDIEDTELLGCGPVLSTQNMTAFEQDMQQQCSAASLICMSGSWPSGSDPKAYARLIDQAHNADKKVFLDCSDPWLKPALEQKPFAVHINKAEGEALFGISDPLQMALQLKEYCQIAAVTDGERGLYLATSQEAWHASCRLKEVIGTVGSGDCLTAGLAWAFLQDKQPREMARWGVACGAANCINEALGMITKKDVLTLVKKATSEKIKRIKNDE